MNVLIIEDEQLAAEHLANLLLRINSDITVLDTCDSVKGAVNWLKKYDIPNLIFMDIQLGDGLCFDIFKAIEVNAPVIFTTAYEEYAIRAFKVNSIDYLLKPIDYENLSFAINKFIKTERHPPIEQNIEASVLEKVKEMLRPQYKSRFIVKVGEHIKSMQIADILFFYSFERSTFMCTKTGRNYIVDYSLEEVENITNPQQFFRINRKYLIKLEAVVDMVSYSSSRLMIKLLNSEDDNVIVSREKMQAFKMWLNS